MNTHSSSSTRSTSSSIRSSSSILSVLPHITGRDRSLLELLDEHQVLTTNQIARMLFAAKRTCQIRLNELRQLGLVDRFRFPRYGGGSESWHWMLGHTGARFQAGAHGRDEPTARACRLRVARMSADPRLSHLLAVNELFVRLRTHTRTHPQARLDRWWSEKRATAQFLRVRPDAHGVWSVADATVGFFVEADQGSERLGRLPAKLASYARLAATGGPRYPVLFWLTSPVREEHLHTTLARYNSPVLVATATQDADPAGPVWLPVSTTTRIGLDELPCDHGGDNAANPNYRHGVLHLTQDAGEPDRT